MCIRDRAFLEADRLGLLDDTALIECAGRDIRRRGVRQLRPVSYTHLRAHETVLDIVCRLLLEKKTKAEE